ncbi:hypothetical protein TIFTF001_033821 [Ficus carica]|uniref:Uncharacterized protein n=1 Tax=Ficus carica TaxID=3494 RepID=A0AA88DZG6_FICCA|nr:hypothetical protein TIFTF001_033821 [Ficus carica]
MMSGEGKEEMQQADEVKLDLAVHKSDNEMFCLAEIISYVGESAALMSSTRSPSELDRNQENVVVKSRHNCEPPQIGVLSEVHHDSQRITVATVPPLFRWDSHEIAVTGVTSGFVVAIAIAIQSPVGDSSRLPAKVKEKVNEANVVQFIIARDKDQGEERPETLGTTRESLPEKGRDHDNNKGEEHPETSGTTEESLPETGHDQDNGDGEIEEERREQELIFNYARSLVENVKEKCSIYKVHSGLRKGSAKHYEPVLVSIGPYHYGKRPVQDMEKHKIDYKEVLLHRVKENSIDTYKKALEDERGKPRALDCYADTFRMDVDSFKECMLRDGFFMIELFWRKKNFDECKDSSNDIVFNIRWMKPRLARDMLLFENQIPLLVLRAMFSLTEQTTQEVDFVPLVLNFFEFNGKTIPCDMNLTNRLDDIPHLLGLVYEALVFGNEGKDLVPGPPVQLNMKQKLVQWLIGTGWVRLTCKEEAALFSGRKKKVSAPGPPVQLNGMWTSLKSFTWTVFVRLIEKTFRLKKAQQQNDEQKSCEFIRTGMALEQVGVTFVREEDDVAFYDIKFSSTGILSIPRLLIDDNTESFFRNLVAYEQYSEKNSLHRVVDYLHVMDCLINTSRDVEVLRHCGIIDNRIGDDKKVSTMFNRLCSDVYFNQNEFLYKRMFDDVNKFCMDRTNAWKATLKNEYFGSPWSIISFVAAVLLLLFTATEAVYSVLSYYHSNSSGTATSPSP